MQTRRQLMQLGLPGGFGPDPARDVSIAVLRALRAAAVGFGALGLFVIAYGGVFIGLAVSLASTAVVLAVHNELNAARPSVHTALAVAGVVTLSVRFMMSIK